MIWSRGVLRCRHGLGGAHFITNPPKHLARKYGSKQRAFLKISEEITDAIQTGKPVVALETTIYTHGFPFPDNLALSEQLESIVRRNGGVPAHIGVLNGIAQIGFSSEEMLELLEKASNGHATIKLSRRDLGYICGQGVLGKGVNGGTTIAGTLVLSHLAGIRVFATGGLGGVHKGGEVSMDVSADLTELGRTPVALVSSGCKSFLDIPRTLEYLETQGVGVGTFADGRSGSVDFPAFWTRNSGTPSPRTIHDEKEAAAIMYAQMDLGLSSGLLFANPITEEFSLSREYMDNVMTQAVQDAVDAGITGHANTPFVLSRIRDITRGSTVAANRELVVANAARGTLVAVELAKLEGKGPGSAATIQNANKTDARGPLDPRLPAQTEAQGTLGPHAASKSTVDVLVAGSVAVDVACNYNSANGALSLHTSNPVKMSETIGGVGRNIATALHYLGRSVKLCSAVGQDVAGTAILNSLEDSGISTDAVRTIPQESSARYIAVNANDKDLFIAAADMSIYENADQIFDETWLPSLQQYQPKWLAVDANWDSTNLQRWIQAANRQGTKVAFEPVSVEKSRRLFEKPSARCEKDRAFVELVTPNAAELEAMADQYRSIYPGDSISVPSVSSFVKQAVLDIWPEVTKASNNFITKDMISRTAFNAVQLLPQISCVMVTLGSQGVLMVKTLAEFDTLYTSDTKFIWRKDEGNRALFETINAQREAEAVYMRHFAVPVEITPDQILSVNGTGDTFFGTLLAGLGGNAPMAPEDLLAAAQMAASLTLCSSESVSTKIAYLGDVMKYGLMSQAREIAASGQALNA